MKKIGAVILIACALLLAIVVSGLPQVNSFVTTINAGRSTTFLADGSGPIPPFPDLPPSVAVV
jgi:hypothetical protein